MNEQAEVRELCSLLRSKVPLILIETHEEPRILKLLQQGCNLENQVLSRWSIVHDIGCYRGATSDSSIYQTNELTDALKHIDKTAQNGVYALCDAHRGDPSAQARARSGRVRRRRQRAALGGIPRRGDRAGDRRRRLRGQGARRRARVRSAGAARTDSVRSAAASGG